MCSFIVGEQPFYHFTVTLGYLHGCTFNILDYARIAQYREVEDCVDWQSLLPIYIKDLYLHVVDEMAFYKRDQINTLIIKTPITKCIGCDNLFMNIKSEQFQSHLLALLCQKFNFYDFNSI